MEFVRSTACEDGFDDCEEGEYMIFILCHCLEETLISRFSQLVGSKVERCRESSSLRSIYQALDLPFSLELA